MLDAIDIKNSYLQFMEKRGWPFRKAGTLVDSTFRHCFTISGAVDWFNEKLRNDPYNKEAYVYWVRCFRHYDIPDGIHLPFFWMMLDVSWDFHSREKSIQDNFDFLMKMGLEKEKLRITCWKGGRVFGDGINLSADVEKTCVGYEFEKMQAEGLFIPKDETAIKAWKKCGLRDEQIVEFGEEENLDPSGYDAILLNAREHFAGVRSEVYYPIDDRFIEIGVFLCEEYIKKTVALKFKIPQDILQDDMNGDKFLLKLHPKPVPAGFGFERLAMAVNHVSSFYELDPYRGLIEILIKNSNFEENDVNLKIAEESSAYVSALVWFVHDGAQLITKNRERQKRGIYRKIIKTIIANLRKLNLDGDDIYLELFKKVINFYLKDKECQSLIGLENQCLDEIYKQKGRMKIDEKQALRFTD